MKKLEVLYVAAYWKNDVPGGVNIEIPFEDDGVDGLAFCIALESLLPEIDQIVTVAVAEARLSELSRSRAMGRRPIERDALDIITLVYWLQERGHLVVDNFNGTMFLSRYDGKIVNTENNPATFDFEHEVPNGADVTDIVRGTDRRGSEAALRLVTDDLRQRNKARAGG